MKKEINVINLSEKDFRNDIYIQSLDHIAESLFFPVYEKVIRNISNVIDVNENNSKLSDKVSTVNNIIPFISGRGTGKTSAMVSTMEFLKNGKSLERLIEILIENFGETFKEKNGKVKEYNFVCVDKVDADLLETKENIFETILTEMYAKSQSFYKLSNDKSIEYEMRELNHEFEKVFRYSRMLEEGATMQRSLNLQALHEAAVSKNLRVHFSNLVKKYLHLMNQDGCFKKSYLVIAVDDIDMDIENAFSFMEQVHRYLMVPNVIVFLAFDMTQLIHICEKHYMELCPEKAIIMQEMGTERSYKYWTNYVSVVAQNYIDKILPSENRVYLPGIRNENKAIYLTGYRKENGKSNQNEPEEIKKVVFRKIFHRTGIICDALGKKKHYYEPDTLRKVISFVEYLNRMEKIPQTIFSVKGLSDEVKQTIEEEKLYMNMQTIYKDIVERMENEKLSLAQKLTFDNIRRQHITRQTKGAYDFLKGELEKSDFGDYEEDRWMNTLLDEEGDNEESNLHVKYSFGEYMHFLYRYSTNIEKMMVHLLLALQTANLTKLYNEARLLYRISFLNNISEEDKIIKKKEYQEKLEMFKSIFGDSITGSWFKQMWRDELMNPLSKKTVVSDKYIVNIASKGSKKEYVQRAVYAIHTLYMIFPNAKKIEVVLENDILKIKVEKGMQFDSLGFVIGAMDYETHFEKIQCSIEHICNQDSEWTKDSADIIKKLKDEYQEWTKEKGFLALPIYSLDIYYNLLKRLYEGAKEDKNIDKELQDITKKIVIWGIDDVNSEDYKKSIDRLKAYLKILNKIEYQLKLQDEYYADDEEEKLNNTILQEIFTSCPFVKILFNKSSKRDKTFALKREVVFNIIEGAFKLNYGTEKNSIK